MSTTLGPTTANGKPAETRQTFEGLCRLEPRLRSLANMASNQKAVARGKRNYCANHVWYREFKPRLLGLVGWHARPDAHPALRSQGAYDVAYSAIYNLLPDCRRCGCLSLADLRGW